MAWWNSTSLLAGFLYGSYLGSIIVFFAAVIGASVAFFILEILSWYFRLLKNDDRQILINLKNEQLSTEKLFWNRENKTIYTDDFVTINTDKQIIMGYGFVTDQSFSTYSLSNITGTIYL